jgi:5'-nucleotidase
MSLARSLGIKKYMNSYEEKIDSEGNSSYWLAGDIIKAENGNTTDIFAVDNNYVSVTPMHYELTKFDYLEVINSWKFEMP